MDENIRQLISNAKNIAVVPSTEPEAVTAALALFYSIQESGKHATVLVDTVPEKLQFLIPSLDFITAPRNFVISIPRTAADISQIYYEKTGENLKIHFTTASGRIKKEDLSFYTEEPSPDLVITLGITNFHQHLQKNLNESGFLLGSTILNIDNHSDNKKFGKENLVEQRSLAEIIMEVMKEWGQIQKPAVTCLLTGLALYYNNFKSFATRPETFQLAAELVKKGAEYHTIVDQLSRSTDQELKFFSLILSNIQRGNPVSVATISSDEFHHFSEHQAQQAVEKLKAVGALEDTLVLWQGHASEPTVKGFFTSQNASTINKLAPYKDARIHKGWVFISTPGTDLAETTQRIVQLLS